MRFIVHATMKVCKIFINLIEIVVPVLDELEPFIRCQNRFNLMFPPRIRPQFRLFKLFYLLACYTHSLQYDLALAISQH